MTGRDQHIRSAGYRVRRTYAIGGCSLGYSVTIDLKRTQSGKLNEAMKVILPRTMLIGFTGRPLLKKDNKKASDINGEETGEGLTEKLRKYEIYRKTLADYFDEPEDKAMSEVEQFEKGVVRTRLATA